MRKLQVAGGAFSAIVGFCDIFTFVRYQAFCATMTGNTIMLVRSICVQFLGFSPFDERRLGTPLPAMNYISIILCWLGGVLIFFLVEWIFPKRASAVLGVTVGSLSLITHTIYLAVYGIDVSQRWITVLFLSCIFGMINAMATLGGTGPVTAITGHLVKIVKGLVTLCSKGFDWKVVREALLSFSVYVGLFSGCLLGIVATKPSFAGRYPVLLPVGPLLGLLMWYHDHLRQGYKILKGWHRKHYLETGGESEDSQAIADGEHSDPDITDPSGDEESSDNVQGRAARRYATAPP